MAATTTINYSELLSDVPTGIEALAGPPKGLPPRRCTRDRNPFQGRLHLLPVYHVEYHNTEEAPLSLWMSEADLKPTLTTSFPRSYALLSLFPRSAWEQGSLGADIPRQSVERREEELFCIAGKMC